MYTGFFDAQIYDYMDITSKWNYCRVLTKYITFRIRYYTIRQILIVIIWIIYARCATMYIYTIIIRSEKNENNYSRDATIHGSYTYVLFDDSFILYSLLSVKVIISICIENDTSLLGISNYKYSRISNDNSSFTVKPKFEYSTFQVRY